MKTKKKAYLDIFRNMAHLSHWSFLLWESVLQVRNSAHGVTFYHC